MVHSLPFFRQELQTHIFGTTLPLIIGYNKIGYNSLHTIYYSLCLQSKKR